jgi:predicted transcriptional regulator
VSIKKSLSHDHLVCLEDGRRFKSLKRHLQAEHGLTPEAYRAKWGLGKDYPMVAPAYADARSNLAKTIGLGRKAPPAPEPAPAAASEQDHAEPAAKPGRRKAKAA